MTKETLGLVTIKYAPLLEKEHARHAAAVARILAAQAAEIARAEAKVARAMAPDIAIRARRTLA